MVGDASKAPINIKEVNGGEIDHLLEQTTTKHQ